MHTTTNVIPSIHTQKQSANCVFDSKKTLLQIVVTEVEFKEIHIKFLYGQQKKNEIHA